jgi:Polyketide cyclase / dehydrase and lipid transport
VRPAHAEASIDLPYDVEVVWAAVVDWPAQAGWMLFTEVRPVTRNGRGAGATVRARTGVGPVGFTDDMEITHWSPPHECRVHHLGRVVRGDGTFAVRSAGAGCTFTWSEDLVLPFGRLGTAVWPLIRPGSELMMRVSLNRLARRLAAR